MYMHMIETFEVLETVRSILRATWGMVCGRGSRSQVERDTAASQAGTEVWQGGDTWVLDRIAILGLEV